MFSLSAPLVTSLGAGLGGADELLEFVPLVRGGGEIPVRIPGHVAAQREPSPVDPVEIIQTLEHDSLLLSFHLVLL